MWGPQYTFAQSLPLQVCDLAGLVGPMALLTRKQWLRAILYFWGLGLSIQGFIQPVLKDKGLGDVEFWLFWANHTMIVGTAVYDLVALGFRPKTRDFLIAVGRLTGVRRGDRALRHDLQGELRLRGGVRSDPA